MVLPCPTENKGGILLVEEYDALALPVQLALAKFAPHHQVTRAASLVEAGELAPYVRPELVVLDDDPPLAGIVGFIEQLREHLPHCRALIVAAGALGQLNCERAGQAALYYLEKPFDLTELAAAVQALVCPGSSAPTLRDLDVFDAAVLASLGASNIALEVRSTNGGTGKLYFQHGRIVHAEAESLAGERAVVQLLRMGSARVEEAKLLTIPAPSLKGDSFNLLLRTWREVVASPVTETQRGNDVYSPETALAFTCPKDTDAGNSFRAEGSAFAEMKAAVQPVCPVPPESVAGGNGLEAQPARTVPLPRPPAQAAGATLRSNEGLLDLRLHLVWVRLDSRLQMQAVGARLATPTVALQLPGLAEQSSWPAETSFQLGELELDSQGRIATIRLLPSGQSFQPGPNDRPSPIAHFAVLSGRAGLELKCEPETAVSMQLFGPVELTSIDLSPTMDVRQLVLRPHGHAVRAVLDCAPPFPDGGLAFKISAVQLDTSQRLQELTLSPAG